MKSGKFATIAAAFISEVWICCAIASAQVRPVALFTDHAVLQRDAVVPVWGMAEADEPVTVSFADQKCKTRADSQGAWRVDLHPMPQSATLRDMTIAGKTSTLTVHDILVGEVWVCSGQSNMTFELNRAQDADKEIAAAADPNVRLFDVPRVPSQTPVKDVKSHWNPCDPQSAATFSAVAYFFGRELSHELNVPVGIIHSSLGGTIAQNWSPREVLEDPRFSKVLDRERQRLENLPAANQAYQVKLEAWQALSPEERSATTKPTAPLPAAQKGGPSYLYNGMIAPLVPYSVRGILWFQGESNRRDPNNYRALLPEMIRGWRTAWGQPKLPFVMVQIANYMPPEGESGPRSQWAEIREVQRLTAASVGDASLVVTIDLGESKNLHPKDKHDVGHRSVLAALKDVYGRSNIASGPTLKNCTFGGGNPILSFDEIGSGLVQHGDELTGFTIAGSDRKFVEASARLDGATVVVHSDAVPNPVAVRYAWSADPHVSLYNSEGLPAGPFRTDSWPWGGQDPSSQNVVDPR